MKKNKVHRKKSTSNRKKSISKKKSVKFAPKKKEIIIQDLDLLDKDKHIPVKVKLLNPKVNIKIHKPKEYKPREIKKIESFGQTLEEDPYNLKQRFIDSEIEKVKNSDNTDYTKYEFNQALKDFVNANPAVYWRNNKLIIDEMYDEILYKVSKFFESKKIIKEKEEYSSTRKLAVVKGNYTRFVERFNNLYRKYELYKSRDNKTFEMYENMDNDFDKFIDSKNNAFDDQSLKDIGRYEDYKDKINKIYDAKKSLLDPTTKIIDASDILKPTKKIKVKKPSETIKPIIQRVRKEKKKDDILRLPPKDSKKSDNEENDELNITDELIQEIQENQPKLKTKILQPKKYTKRNIDKVSDNILDDLIHEIVNEEARNIKREYDEEVIDDVKNPYKSLADELNDVEPTKTEETTTPMKKTEKTNIDEIAEKVIDEVLNEDDEYEDEDETKTTKKQSKTTNIRTRIKIPKGTKTTFISDTKQPFLTPHQQLIKANRQAKAQQKEKEEIERKKLEDDDYAKDTITTSFNKLNSLFKGKFKGLKPELLEYSIQNKIFKDDNETNPEYLSRVYELYNLSNPQQQPNKVADELLTEAITDNFITLTPIKQQSYEPESFEISQIATPQTISINPLKAKLLNERAKAYEEIDYLQKNPSGNQDDDEIFLTEMYQKINDITTQINAIDRQGRGRHRKGGNFFKNAFNKIKHVIFNTGSPQTDKVIKEYGQYIIKNAMIHRKPVDKILKDIINIISLGQFNNYKKSYDEVFHLSVVFECELNGNKVYLMTEKRPNIYWQKVNSLSDYESKDNSMVHLSKFKPCTLEMMIEKTKQIMGSNFNTYNAKTNNCQQYVVSLFEAYFQLQRFPLPTIIRNYIYQDMTPFITKFAEDSSVKVTDLGHLFNRVLGAGQRRLKNKKIYK